MAHLLYRCPPLKSQDHCDNLDRVHSYVFVNTDKILLLSVFPASEVSCGLISHHPPCCLVGCSPTCLSVLTYIILFPTSGFLTCCFLCLQDLSIPLPGWVYFTLEEIIPLQWVISLFYPKHHHHTCSSLSRTEPIPCTYTVLLFMYGPPPLL